jgi:hypothetical protein
MPKKQASILQHTHAKTCRLWSNLFGKQIGPAESSKWTARQRRNEPSNANHCRFLAKIGVKGDDVESGSRRSFLRQSGQTDEIRTFRITGGAVSRGGLLWVGFAAHGWRAGDDDVGGAKDQ